MSTLTVSCSKPDCEWSGPPADAATHPCPTTAEAELLADIAHEPETDAAAAPLLATRDELAAWLVQHGDYDQNGQPKNDATRQADEQYAALVAAERDAEEQARAPEPDLADEPAIDGEADEQPWQVTVVEQVRARDDAKQIRWAIVDEDAAELVAAHGMKASAEADLITWNAGGREVTLHRISDLAKEADAAAVEPAPPVEPEPDLEPAPEPEPEPLVETPVPLETDPAIQTDLAVDDEFAAVAEQLETAEPEPAPGGALFDPSDYDREDLAIPKVDGQSIDRIALDFGGAVMLDRSMPPDVELYNRVHGSRELELWISAKWGGTGAKPATNREGELDVIVGRKSLRVESIRIVNPEELGQLKGLELVRAATRAARNAGVPDDQIENAVTATLADLT